MVGWLVGCSSDGGGDCCCFAVVMLVCYCVLVMAPGEDCGCMCLKGLG